MSALNPSSDSVAALENDAEAAARFDSLPPSHHKDQLTWIDAAKQPVTPTKPMAGMFERLSSGRVV